MNLKTAALLCERFLPVMAEGGLNEKLGLLLAAADTVYPDAVSRSEAVKQAAKDALHAYQSSFFADMSMRLFPEFRQLGFADAMDEPVRHALERLSEGTIETTEAADRVATIAKHADGLRDLTDQVEKLLALADYFGVEKRDAFEADAVAVIAAPAPTGTHSPEMMDRFIDRVQTFQTVVAFCDLDEAAIDHNIRMIDGDTSLLVADMSAASATRLHDLLSEVGRVHAAAAEIGHAHRRLGDVGVSAPLLADLDQERAAFRRFEKGGSLRNVSDFLRHVSNEEIRKTAMALLAMLDEGVRINSVILRKPEEDLPAEDLPLQAPPGDVARAASMPADKIPVDPAPLAQETASEDTEVKAATAPTLPEPRFAWYEFEDIKRDRQRALRMAREQTEQERSATARPEDPAPDLAPDLIHENGGERKESASKTPAPAPVRSVWRTFSKR